MRASSNFECQKRYEKMFKEEEIASKDKTGKCHNSNTGTSIYIVGIGPGGEKYFTLRAIEALEKSEVIVCYTKYKQYVREYLKNKEVYLSGMTKEIERAEKAIEYALNNKIVSVVSTGDAGIYGMAGLIFELLEKKNLIEKLEVEVVPGVSAFNAAAAVIGAPIMHDFAVISLSDLLTDWDTIKKRIELAAKGDFVISIYNPKSKKRVSQIEEARDILLKYKKQDTPVAIVKNALRDNQSVVLTNLENFLKFEIDMFSVLIIGNSTSKILSGRYFITPRGYHQKY